MRKAAVFVNLIEAGILEHLSDGKYQLTYHDNYNGSPVSLTMPTKNKVYVFNQFPPFFEGLLPEGDMLEAMLRKYKLDKSDYFGQLLQVGNDVVGAVTVKEIL